MRRLIVFSISAALLISLPLVAKKTTPAKANKILLAAAEKGDVRALKKALKSKADPNVQNESNDSALFIAAANNHLEIVHLLMAAGAKVNFADDNGKTVLMMATKNGNRKMVEKLLAAGAIDKYPLHTAASIGNLERVKSLIQESAMDVNTPDHQDCTALFGAAANGHAGIAEFLIQMKANPSANCGPGWTPLLYAIEENHMGIAKMLIAAKADANAKEAMSGRTLLMTAARLGQAETVKLLIKAGADLNAKDNEGNTSLMYAKTAAKLQVVKILQAAGAKL